MGLSYKDTRQDVLTDVLSALRFRSKIFCVSELSAPWALTLPPGDFAHFHVIERGGGWVQLIGEETSVPLASGDLVVIPYGSGHVLRSDLQTAPASLEQLLQRQATGEPILRYGGGGVETNVVCGAFQFENAAENPILSLLPPLLHLRAGGGQSDVWLEPTLRLLTHEAREARAGSGAIVTRLTDVIFIQAVRAWIAMQPPGTGGWLGALRDKHIGAALQLLHGEPARAWTVAALASAVGMSRSPFAVRFTALVGDTPLAYLTRWRMHVAAGDVLDGRSTMREIAERVGYASEAAFSKAFKRQFGMSPRDYRNTYAAKGEVP